MPEPTAELRAAAVTMRGFHGPAAVPIAKLLAEYANDWEQCPEDHPGTPLDEAALAAARAINGGVGADA